MTSQVWPLTECYVWQKGMVDSKSCFLCLLGCRNLSLSPLLCGKPTLGPDGCAGVRST